MYKAYTLNVGVESRVEMYFSKVKRTIWNTLDIITVGNGDDDEFLKKKKKKESFVDRVIFYCCLTKSILKTSRYSHIHNGKTHMDDGGEEEK